MRKVLKERFNEYNTDSRKLFKLAAEEELLYNVDKWKKFQYLRSIISNVYQQNFSELVFAHLDDFRIELDNLVRRLQ